MTYRDLLFVLVITGIIAILASSVWMLRWHRRDWFRWGANFLLLASYTGTVLKAFLQAPNDTKPYPLITLLVVCIPLTWLGVLLFQIIRLVTTPKKPSRVSEV